MIYLKPCPSPTCSASKPEAALYECGGRWCVRCECGTTGQEFWTPDYKSARMTQVQAVSAWNRLPRAKQDAPELTFGRLKAIVQTLDSVGVEGADDVPVQPDPDGIDFCFAPHGDIPENKQAELAALGCKLERPYRTWFVEVKS